MKNPLITMTAITGKPTEEQICEYLSSLKENRIEQTLLYPRSGCELEYLSEEWFNTVSHFLHYARELDMYIWLYDDFNWPSGDAGGRVTAKEEYRLKSICISGENIGKISCKSRHNSGLFGEKFFPDLLSYEAVDCFISCTHEEYFKRFGEFFGTVIKGIYTDEPSIGYCCGNGALPYYKGIEEDYCLAFNRDFKEDVLNSYKDLCKNTTTIASRRFKSSYFERLKRWTQKHSILMTGHLMNDNNFIGGIKHSGNVLENLSVFSLPGIDEIATDFKDECEMALFATAEYASNENGAMAELFALGPCDMSFAKIRCMLYLAACHKINHYFLAISPMDMRGNLLVTDYFNCFSCAQPNFYGMKLLASEGNALCKIAEKDFTPDVYIRYPFSTFAPSAGYWQETISLFNMLNELTYNQIQWKLIDGEEKTDFPVIEISADFKFTIDKKPLDISKIKKRITVTDKDGNTPQGIFVRRFNDGERVVLNLFAPDDEYYIDGKKQYLEKYCVYTEKQEDFESKEIIFTDFDVACKNIARLMYIDSQSTVEIRCENDTEVIFSVREGTKAFINGEELIPLDSANHLPQGMKEYYKSSKVAMKKGTSIIQGENDFKYMPSIIVWGDFVCSYTGCNLLLKKQEEKYTVGDKLQAYGEVELSATLTVPQNACALEICGAEHLTRVYIDGELLGEKIISPFVFALTKAMCGKKAELKIVQYTSMAPIFGDVALWDREVEKCQWRGTPPTENRMLGFKEIKWCFNE